MSCGFRVGYGVIVRSNVINSLSISMGFEGS